MGEHLLVERDPELFENAQASHTAGVRILQNLHDYARTHARRCESDVHIAQRQSFF